MQIVTLIWKGVLDCHSTVIRSPSTGSDWALELTELLRRPLPCRDLAPLIRRWFSLQKYLGGYKRQPELTETVKMTTMALLQGAPSVLKTASPFTARVNRSTALVPSGRRARSVALLDH